MQRGATALNPIQNIDNTKQPSKLQTMTYDSRDETPNARKVLVRRQDIHMKNNSLN